MLIGVQFGYTKCSSHICLYSSRYISFSWGGPFKIFAPKPFLCWCFRNFSDDFCALDLKRVLRWNFGLFWGGSGNRKTDLGGFRQRKNGQQWKKTANTDVFKGYGMLENWTHCNKQCFGPIFYWRTHKLCCFWRKDWNNTVRTCVLDRLYAQKCKKYMGVEGKQSKNTAIFFKHLYKDWTKKLAVWAAPHAKRGEYNCSVWCGLATLEVDFYDPWNHVCENPMPNFYNMFFQIVCDVTSPGHQAAFQGPAPNHRAKDGALSSAETGIRVLGDVFDWTKVAAFEPVSKALGCFWIKESSDFSCVMAKSYEDLLLEDDKDNPSSHSIIFLGSASQSFRPNTEVVVSFPGVYGRAWNFLTNESKEGKDLKIPGFVVIFFLSFPR